VKAIIWTKYGPPEVLQLQEVEKPTPKANEVLVKIHAASVSAGDCELRSMNTPLSISLPWRLLFGIRRPKRVRILGQEIAGVVEAVGAKVTRIEIGDAVFALLGLKLGGYAEYRCLPEAGSALRGRLALKPANISFEQAAAIPIGGLDAVHFLSRAQIQPGEQVLINGAGGSIGTFGVQLARYLGADVTAVDSTGKLEMLSGLGAERVIDYTKVDFTRTGDKYDVIFEVPGKASYSDCINALKEGGRLLLINPDQSHLKRGRKAQMASGKRVITRAAEPNAEDDLETLRGLIESGALKPVIDRIYPLEQIVEAHRYVESGQKKGNVVIGVLRS
jgi:NADPH:quinone reductase-like Zn-dependent oxidoreductase